MLSEQISRRVRHESVKRYTDIIEVVVKQAAVAVISFALARTAVFEDYAPFGAAAAAAMPTEYTIAAGLGAILGYFAPVTGGNGFRYIAAAFAAAAIKWLVSGLFRGAKTAAFSALTAFLSILSTGTVMLAFTGFSGSGLMLYTAEGLLGGGAAYFIHNAMPFIGSRRKISSLSAQELTCVVITMSLILLSLTAFTIWQISPARIVAVLAVLAAARWGHETGGAIAGIAAGLVLALSGNGLSFSAAGFAFGGLIAGVFSPLGSIACSVAFVLSNGMFALQSFENPELLPVLYEVVAASVLFPLIPRGIGTKLSEFFSPAPDMPRVDGLRKSVVMRLKFASAALSDVSETVDSVSEKLKKTSAPEFDSVFSATEQSSCRRCGMRLYCWETSRGETIDALLQTTKVLRRKKYVSVDDMPEAFTARCAHPQQVLEALNRKFSDYLNREAAERRVCEVRSVVAEQFNGIADMLNDMACELEESQRYDQQTAENIDTALRSVGIVANDISCSIDQYGRMTSEIRISNETSEHANRAIVMREVSSVCNRDFDVPCLTAVTGGVLMTLSEKANLSVDFGAAQFSCDNNRLCGDAFDYFTDGKGRAVMIISDGMGCGGRAAVDGAMASGLMARLIKAGFGFDCALNIVNSAMLFKSSDESLATVDISCIDLFTGSTDFYKAGAPATIIRRSGKTSCAECAALPAGILREVGFDQSSATLSEGDIIVMISDGAAMDGLDWIGVELEVWRDGSAQQLAEHIADYARRRRGDGRQDDITVVTAIIERGI